jgi:hypothetical protein
VVPALPAVIFTVDAVHFVRKHWEKWAQTRWGEKKIKKDIAGEGRWDKVFCVDRVVGEQSSKREWVEKARGS